MKALIVARHSRKHQIACVWHPEAKGDVVMTDHLGNIRVQVGPAKYQLSTAEIIEIGSIVFQKPN